MPEVSDIAKDLMLHLIATPERRLGRSGIEDFINHPFFDGISWDRIREGTASAVFVAYMTTCYSLRCTAEGS